MKRSEGTSRILWQRVSLIVLCVVLALVLCALLFATAYVHHLLNLVSNSSDSLNGTLSPEDMATATDPDNDPDFTGPTVGQNDVTQDTVPNTPTDNENIINILLIGEDRRPGEGRQRSDSMILCSFNTNTNTLTMISFLRDTYISSIPGYGKAEKLNAAYCFGGAKMLNQTLAAYFGVHVDANVAVQFDGFVGVIDMLGGVDIELTRKEANYLNDLHQIYGWTLTAGMNHLTGEQALAYSRIRYLDGDAYRAQRQRKVLTALINAYKNKPLSEMLTLTVEILETGFIETDMSTDQVISYVKKLFPMLATATINNQQIPAAGTYDDMTVGTITATKVCDLEVNRKILQQILQ